MVRVPQTLKCIRHYGALANGCKKTQLVQARAALQQPAPSAQAREPAEAFMARVARIELLTCPKCRGRLHVAGTLNGQRQLPAPGCEGGARCRKQERCHEAKGLPIVSTKARAQGRAGSGLAWRRPGPAWVKKATAPRRCADVKVRPTEKPGLQLQGGQRHNHRQCEPALGLGERWEGPGMGGKGREGLKNQGLRGDGRQT